MFIIKKAGGGVSKKSISIRKDVPCTYSSLLKQEIYISYLALNRIRYN